MQTVVAGPPGARRARRPPGPLGRGERVLPRPLARGLRVRTAAGSGMTAGPVALRWVTSPGAVEPELTERLVACWREVSDAGGAVGFPFPPVTDAQVRPAVEQMVQGLASSVDRLLLATVDGALAGWLLLQGNPGRLTGHWARVLRVQTALEHRGTGVGRALMTEVARAAADDLGLEQLHLELRSGLGLEAFYRALGWREVGRWPAALRLPEADRDEVLMLLPLRPAATR